MDCEVLWKTYDQATLDAQYNAAGTVPSLDPYFARYTEQSERVRRAYPCRVDLPYGEAERERLDLFPADRAGAPVVLFLHGGYWRRMSKADFSFFAEPFVQAGAVVAIPSYSLCPSCTIDDIVCEARAVVRWLHENVASAHGDPERIVVCGHSAGGQIGGMLASTDWAAQGLPRTPIAGMCGMSGLYDLEPVMRSNCNEWLRLDDDAARRNSPIYHLPQDAMPLVAAVGERETDEFQRQTADFATAWRERGHPAECLVMTGRNHYDMPLDVLRPDSELRACILKLL
jgi:arylformamidase